LLSRCRPARSLFVSLMLSSSLSLLVGRPIALRAGEFVRLADVRVGINEDARPHGASVTHDDEGERQVGG